MAFDAHKPFAISTVSAAPSPAASGTSLTITPAEATRFPAVPFNASVYPSGNVLPTLANSEIIRVTALNTGTGVATILRTQEGTSARTIVAGDYIVAGDTPKTITDIEAATMNGLILVVAASDAPQVVKDHAGGGVCDGTNDGVEIMAALTGWGALGGRVELSQGNFSISTQRVEMPHATWLAGQGLGATFLNRANGVQGPLVYNKPSSNGTTDPNAKKLRIEKLRINGNSANVTPNATTAAGSNPQFSPFLNVADASAFLPAPNWIIIDPFNAAGHREVFRYDAIVGNQFQFYDVGISDRWDKTQFVHNVGEVVRQYWAEILFEPYPQWDPKPSGDEYEDSTNIIDGVWIQDTEWDGINIRGFSASKILNSQTLYAGLSGLVVGSDTFVENCNIGQSGYAGVRVNSNAHLVNVLSYYSGNTDPTQGYGFLLEGNLGGKLTGCYAQDNKADGYVFSWCLGFNLAGCNADSNGASWDGVTPAINPYSGVLFRGNAQFNIIAGMTCVARNNGLSGTQTHAITFKSDGGSPISNSVKLVHFNGGRSVLAPINPTAGYLDGGGNNLEFNNQRGHQTIPFGTGTITPDPYVGGLITVGQLTANLTINNPTSRHPGVQMTLMFTQDATTARQVVWGTDFDASGWQPSSVLGSKSSITFTWDGAKWAQNGSDLDIYAAATFVSPPGLFAATLSAVTAITTNNSHIVYLGRVTRSITSVQIIVNIPTTAGAGFTWAEAAIFKGVSAPNAAASLSRVGSVSATAASASGFGSTGRKVITIPVTGVQPGDELWAAIGAQATTMPVFRGMLADDLQSGIFQLLAGQPSTRTVPVSSVLAGATVVPPWLVARF